MITKKIEYEDDFKRISEAFLEKKGDIVIHIFQKEKRIKKRERDLKSHFS